MHTSGTTFPNRDSSPNIYFEVEHCIDLRGDVRSCESQARTQERPFRYWESPISPQQRNQFNGRALNSSNSARALAEQDMSLSEVAHLVST
jgi:hypothetical protein